MRVEPYEDHDYRIRFGYEPESHLPHVWAAAEMSEEREVPDLHLDCGCVQQRCNRCEF